MFTDIAGAALDRGWAFLHDEWLLLAVIAIALLLGRRWSVRLPRLAMRDRPWVAAGIIAAVALTWSTSIALVRGVPLPLIHDDFACLLGGQMFASGHASYPTHPLWRHFETEHVLQVPSYASKYPPGQSLLLALGIRLFGIALAGSWLGAAAACMAIYWAMRAFMPPGWAFAGGLAAAVHPTMLDWAQSYHGGPMSACGGALLFGAAYRMTADTRARYGLVAGAGLALLAISRPYEGVVLAIAVAIAFVVTARKLPALAPVAAAASMVLLGAAGLAANDRAVTGSATTLPWNTYAAQYDAAPPFFWQKAPPSPVYRNAELRFLNDTIFLGQYRRIHADGGLLSELDKKVDFITHTAFGGEEWGIGAMLWPLFLVPLVMLPAVLRRDAGARFAAIVLALFAFAPLSLTGWLLTHYLAPAAAAACVLLVILFRALLETKRGAWLALAVAVLFVINAAATWHMWLTRDGGIEATRRQLVAAAGPAPQLFLVAPDVEGVLYNLPDIDHAAVVWARDLGDNRELLHYFRNRHVWRVVKVKGELKLMK